MKGPAAGKRQAKLDRKMAKALNSGWSCAGPTFTDQMWDQLRTIAVSWRAAPKDSPDRALLLEQMRGAAQMLVIRERLMGRTWTVKEAIKHALSLSPLDYRTEADKAAERQKRLRAPSVTDDE